MLDYSFSSDTQNKRAITEQQSILKEYKRLGFGEQTIQYSIQSLDYTTLPANFPEELQNGEKCLKLSNCGFFEMLTYSVFEFIFKNRSLQKDQILKRMKRIICDKKFMQDCPSTKGLLLKGMRIMSDKSSRDFLENRSKPIAHCLWKSDSMLAFSQFWKCLLSRISVKNILDAQNTSDLDTCLFQLLADYLQVNCSIYYQKDTQFEHQIYYSRKYSSKLTLRMIVYCDTNSNKPASSRILDSSVLNDRSKQSISESLQWNYIIVQDNHHESELLKQEISVIEQVDESAIIIDEKEQLMRLFKSNNLNHKPRSELLVISSHLKSDVKNLQSTRARKSTQPKINSHYQFQLDENLESIKKTIIQGDQLLQNMKQFCQNQLKI